MPLVLLLIGWVFGNGNLDVKLESASRSASDALDVAREIGTDETHGDELSQIENKYEEAERQRRNSPSRDLLNEFQSLERGSYRLAINSLHERLEQRKTNYENLQEKSDKIQDELQTKIDSLNEKISSLDEENQKLTEKKQEFENKNQELQKKNQELVDKRDNLTETVERLRERQSTLADSNTVLRKRLSKLRKKTQSLSDDNSDLRDTIRSFRSEKQNFQSRLDKQKTRVNDLKQRLEERNQKLKKLQNENSSIREEVENNVDRGEVVDNQNNDAKQNDPKGQKGVNIAIQTNVLFEGGSVSLRPSIRKELETIADILKNYPDREIRIEGHTDDLPLSSELKRKYESNWELSAIRAVNVLKFLVYGQGIDKDRIAAVAYGQFRPRVPNTSTENRVKNRRVEVVLLPPDFIKETFMIGDS